jgi:hypothetical protein
VEVVSGNLAEGQQVITGMAVKPGGSNSTSQAAGGSKKIGF